MEDIRINKYIALSGVCSRREADKLILARKVTINDKVAVLGDKVKSGDTIKVNGKIIELETEKIYIAFHKPHGVISTTDPNADNNVMSYIDLKKRIFPIGRLDVQSSGLMLLTNDGSIVNNISKAQSHREKEYLVTVDKPLTEEFLTNMAEGVHLFHRLTLPAKVKKLGPKDFSITIVQGMNKQIRRMCEALGYEVKVLKRVRIMNILLDTLPKGKWRFLTQKEQKTLLSTLQNEEPKKSGPSPSKRNFR